MIIKNPGQNVVGFKLLEWLVENESSPKKVVSAFLRDIYKKLCDDVTKAAEEEVDEEDENEDENETRDEDEDEVELCNILTHTYPWFSLTENGEVLLITDDKSPNLLLTDNDAKVLLPKLKDKMEERMAKLKKLMA